MAGPTHPAGRLGRTRACSSPALHPTDAHPLRQSRPRPCLLGERLPAGQL